MTSLAAFLKEMHSDVEETITPLNFFKEVSYFMFLSISDIHLYLLKPLKRAGEGKRPWATTISPSVPHISFFLLWQPWATFISPSVPPHLTLPGKTTFLNGIFRAFKVWFLKIQPRHAKKHNSNHFFNSTLDWYFATTSSPNLPDQPCGFIPNSVDSGTW